MGRRPETVGMDMTNCSERAPKSAEPRPLLFVGTETRGLSSRISLVTFKKRASTSGSMKDKHCPRNSNGFLLSPHRIQVISRAVWCHVLLPRASNLKYNKAIGTHCNKRQGHNRGKVWRCRAAHLLALPLDFARLAVEQKPRRFRITIMSTPSGFPRRPGRWHVGHDARPGSPCPPSSSTVTISWAATAKHFRPTFGDFLNYRISRCFLRAPCAALLHLFLR